MPDDDDYGSFFLQVASFDYLLQSICLVGLACEGCTLGETHIPDFCDGYFFVVMAQCSTYYKGDVDRAVWSNFP